MRVKVLQVITQSSWGGAQRYVYDIAAHMADTYTMVVAHGKNEFGGEPLFEKKLAALGVRTVYVPHLLRAIQPLYDAGALYQLVRLFRAEQLDVVHLHSSKAGLLGSVAARIVGVPRIFYTVHGLPQLEKRSFMKRYIFTWVTWITCLCVHKIIVLSVFEKNMLTSWWGVKDKVVHIYTGIDAPNFLSKEQARKHIGEIIGRDIRNEYIIGGIAELTENKGLHEWLATFAARKDAAIYIHMGTGALKNKLSQHVKALGLSKKVHLLGFVPDASTYVKAFDLFVLPSKKEGLPYVLLEAKMAGVPIEATPVGGVPEILENPVTHFSKKRMMAQIKTLYDS